VRFLRTTEDMRYYHPINDDVVSLVRAQGGYITGWGGQQVPLMNSFFGGPTMVRGFAPNGFGPRDLTPGTTMDNVGGSVYWATTAELQSAIPGVPQEYGLKATAFVDAGSVFHYGGPTTFPGSTQSLQVANANVVRSSVGAGLTWASPFGALTVDYAVPLTKAAYDVVQPLRSVPEGSRPSAAAGDRCRPNSAKGTALQRRKSFTRIHSAPPNSRERGWRPETYRAIRGHVAQIAYSSLTDRKTTNHLPKFAVQHTKFDVMHLNIRIVASFRRSSTHLQLQHTRHARHVQERHITSRAKRIQFTAPDINFKRR